MQLEVGDSEIARKFGAFVSFEGGQTGMVHISEIAPTFVTEIHDFVYRRANGKGQSAFYQRRREDQPFYEEGAAGRPAAQTQPPA